jgi:hypothetical protein
MNEDLIYTADKIFAIVNNYIDNTKSSLPKNFNVEYEYKIKCSKKIFLQLLQGMQGNICKLEQTSNEIKSFPGDKNANMRKFVRSKYYFPGSNITEHIKQRLLDANIYKFCENVKLSVSLEYELEHYPSTSREFFRLKNRLSFPIDEWRYDFTQTKHVKSEEASNVKSYAFELFSDLSSYEGEQLFQRFIKSCENNIIGDFEIEIEYLGTKNPLEDKDMFKGLGKKSYLKIMYDNIVANMYSLLNIYTRKMLSLKSLLPAAETMTAKSYNAIYPPIGCYITNKADGERALMIVYDNDCILFATMNKLILGTGEVCNENNTSNILHIIEGEIIEKYFLTYDIIMADKVLMIEEIFSDRLQVCAKIISQLMAVKSEIKISIKPTYLITKDIYESFKNVIENKPKYKCDGYVLTESSKNYFNTKNYKIKEHNTIDFLAVKLPKKYFRSYDVKQGKHIYLLFNGCSSANIEKLRISMPQFYNNIFGNIEYYTYKPILFCPSNNPQAYIWYVPDKLDKELVSYSKEIIVPLNTFKAETWVIVELEYSQQNDWIFHRIRKDRIDENNYYGNDYLRTAIPTWLSAMNPIKIENMHLPIENYFKSGKESSYFAQTALISFAKSKLISKIAELCKLEQNSFVIDFAAGKGQDLDKVALMELMSRYYNMTHNRKMDMKMAITVLHQDLNEPASKVSANISALFAGKIVPAQAIVCNLAIHYLIETLDAMKNLIANVQNLLAKNGYFLAVYPDGAKIFSLLQVNNGDWISKNGESIKYRIVACYKEKIFAELGQRIKFKTAFLF